MGVLPVANISSTQTRLGLEFNFWDTIKAKYGRVVGYNTNLDHADLGVGVQRTFELLDRYNGKSTFCLNALATDNEDGVGGVLQTSTFTALKWSSAFAAEIKTQIGALNVAPPIIWRPTNVHIPFTLQLGALNFADEDQIILQIGVLNSTRRSCGLQIGFLNDMAIFMNWKSIGFGNDHWMPLVNGSFEYCGEILFPNKK